MRDKGLVGILGSKKRPKRRGGKHAAPEKGDADYVAPKPLRDEVQDDPRRAEGPYDITEDPDDDIARMDLGSVQIPVPEGTQVQVEVDSNNGDLRAAHVLTPVGRVTINAFAAPRSRDVWPEIARELADELRSNGAQVKKLDGPYGPELSAQMGPNALHFIGVDGPRWMLRGVIAGPPEAAEQAPDLLRQLVQKSIVDRGDGPMPVREPLPIRLSEAMAQHVAEQQSGQAPPEPQES